MLLTLKVSRKQGVDLPFGNSGTARGPGVSRGPHEMPLVGFFEFGQGHRGPMIPYCLGDHELSVRPW
ncbi:unnamed protein product [Staurois parvus]|uniref:Uncharacterized protein n=1 Tax=Staurois parvus TaxID=386267 RepID=A0ABN9FUN3_9NEOB|nr:unnamed protein product [Staurois parvus]